MVKARVYMLPKAQIGHDNEHHGLYGHPEGLVGLLSVCRPVVHLPWWAQTAGGTQ
jgi:hypothetical protein